MSLKQRLEQDMKDAMRARDKVRLDTIRMLRAAVRNAEIDQRGELDDAGVIVVLSKQLKLREEALATLEQAGRAEQAAVVRREIEVVRSYLPEPLDEAELSRLIDEAITQSGARRLQDVGKVMGLLMPQVRGRADGALVNRLVRQRLAALDPGALS
ncbi:MAG TPA: GatB/YqeY domain-containing protein [Bacillota bacterium]